MIAVEQLKPLVYQVTEMTHGWLRTKKTHWYYDFNRGLISEKPDFPEGPLTRTLTQDQIDWFNKWYLPKLENKNV